MDKELEVFFKKTRVSGVPYEVDLPVTDSVRLIWATPDAEEHIAYMARVSNPENQDNADYERLIRYLIKHQHWSPFEMVNICLEINTTRDIARQILRHRSFTFQEFSQRYAKVDIWSLPNKVRLQDNKNRQNSIEVDDPELQKWWEDQQVKLIQQANQSYLEALGKGVAKEVARKVLPEGLTMSRMYMNGSLRSWIHYVTLRTGIETQKEHRVIAQRCKDILIELCPTVMKSL
jgi:thymidylate synthase (FAD)